eukprot:2188018-Karenia_brevis.AAC.1
MCVEDEDCVWWQEHAMHVCRRSPLRRQDKGGAAWSLKIHQWAAHKCSKSMLPTLHKRKSR